jgi:8-oxo-dGTP pyrophosphatase MutT (NUDIX family)
VISITNKQNIQKLAAVPKEVIESKGSNYDITWVGLLEVRNKKILMTKERGKNVFQLPGGGQVEGESFEDTLRREVDEELGVKIKKIELYDDFIMPGRCENVMIRFLIYEAEFVGEIVAGDEIEEIKWIDSSYERESLDIGNPTKLRLIPSLVKQGLID